MNRKKKFAFTAGSLLLLVMVACALFSAFHIDQYPDKLWLHRCNSIEKFKEKNPRYPNVELDVVFRPNHRFDVTHDVQVSFGLPLDSLLAESNRRNRGHFWLDIKNLNKDNCHEMLHEMDRLCTTYRFSRQHFILESPEWQLLDTFTQRGYYTSCYVTYDKPSHLNRKKVQDCIEQLRHVADSHATRALSFPGWWYSTIKKYLNRSIDLLTWQHRFTQFEFFLIPIGWKMLKDPQVKVILIKDKGRFHR